MASNVVNQVAYLQTTRQFPLEAIELTSELDKAYVDIANAVNSRIIGIFPTTRSAITGENWFLEKNKKQQVLRQVYKFTNTNNIPHGIDVKRVNRFTKCYGSYTDGTNWYGAIYASNVAIPGQISFYITPTDIVFVVDAAAPVLTDGTIVLEWLSQV